MKIRNLLCALVACTAAVVPLRGATQTWLWPVAGAEAGAGIRYAPQSYIGDELNFGNIYIGAAEGTDALAPVDAVVESFGIAYYYSQQYMVGGGIAAGEDVDARIRSMAAELGGKEDPRYIHVSLCIRAEDGRRIWIGGLRADRIFRTGERIKRGEKLGTVGYCFKKIPEPCLSVSVSNSRGQSVDPMTPFGIPTTFIEPKAVPQITSLTGEEARADFSKLMEVLREAYPGLYDALTPEELDAYCAQTLAAMPEQMPLGDFWRVLKRTAGKIHDSHLYVYPMESDRRRRSIDLPQIYFGWIDSALVATRCTGAYASYYGRRIRSVDGIAADSVCRIVSGYVGGYDGRVESRREYFLVMAASSCYFDCAPGASPKGDVTLEFDDGEQLRLKGWNYTGRDMRGLAPDWSGFVRTNYYPDANFALKMLDDSTAYVGLSTFQLNAVEVDSLAAFIRSAADRPNMIVDVRNNSGGDVEVLARILSFFAEKPFAALGGYQWVAKPSGIASFEGCCMNYGPEHEIIGGFEPVAGREGYFMADDVGAIVPDSVTHYGGRLYVLTNEGSCSAATIFPAAILRNHRGVIVGRETATAYHFMNAMKFADIRLPHSWLTVRVPLVRCVFDTTENPRIPYGRGVLPDYEVRLSLDEIASVRGDSILGYTRALIDRGVYLGEDPFAVEPAISEVRWYWLVAGAASLLIGGMAFVLGRRWRRMGE